MTWAASATVGSSGCGFEQPLEAAFSALLQSTPAAPSGNHDFLRNDVYDGFSATASLLVTGCGRRRRSELCSTTSHAA